MDRLNGSFCKFAKTKFPTLTPTCLKQALNLGMYKPCSIDASLVISLCITFMGVKNEEHRGGNSSFTSWCINLAISNLSRSFFKRIVCFAVVKAFLKSNRFMHYASISIIVHLIISSSDLILNRICCRFIIITLQSALRFREY